MEDDKGFNLKNHQELKKSSNLHIYYMRFSQWGGTGLRDKNSFYHGSIGYRNLLEFETISELFLDFGRKLRFKDFDYYKANITKEKPKYTQLFCFF